MAAGGRRMSRPTPFDLLFGERAGDLAALTSAAAAAGRDPSDRSDFALVPEVQRLLEQLGSPELIAQHPEAAEEYLQLLHALYRFDAAGRHLVAPARQQLERWCLRLPPAAAPEVPGGACYLQLPEQGWWAQRATGDPHEPVDGMFLVASPRADEITLLVVLGLRSGRGGFTQVTIHARPGDFAAARGMRRDPPFAPIMDGGTAAGVRSLATAAEVLTLAHLALLAVHDPETT